jgi:pyruvate/2-oxoglutarate dehydrogenase complex dihydrolipoamide acyltransferase (E2) component
MGKQFILPDLGEGLTEAEIVTWLVQPGDTITVDQPVVEVESAKSVVELPSPFGGVIETLHADAGTTVHAGQPLLTMAGTTDDVGTPDVVPGTAVRDVEEAAEEGSGAVLIGYGTQARKRGPSKAGSGRFGARKATAPAEASETPEPTAQPQEQPTTGPSPVVSPLVRKLARQHGFNASDLVGSGPNSLVMRADVEARIAEGGTPAEVASSFIAQARPEQGDQRIPITGLRKIVSERLSTSRREIPEATIWLDVDATALIEAKDALQRSTGERFSLNALIARFVVAGLKQYPILNSSVDTEAGEIVQHGQINLGLAAQTARGLMVPVVHDAGSMTTRQLRDGIGELVSTAETGSFSGAQLSGGTFTLNNYGGFGVDGSAAIINHPEVAILGIGRIIDRPWVVDGEIVVRKVVVLSLVFDHRVCDGDIPSKFIGFVANCIENPIGLLAEL